MLHLELHVNAQKVSGYRSFQFPIRVDTQFGEEFFFLIEHLCKYSYLILLTIDIPIYPSKWV